MGKGGKKELYGDVNYVIVEEKEGVINKNSHFRDNQSVWYSYLLGLRFGWYGAPSQESYDNYVKNCKVDYRKTYREVYKEALLKYNEMFAESNDHVRDILKKSLY